MSYFTTVCNACGRTYTTGMVGTAMVGSGHVCPLRALAEWLVSMDDPEDVLGREERRKVTLTKIIDCAREALPPVPVFQREEEG